MIICPYCGQENLQGNDFCENCLHDLCHVEKTEESLGFTSDLLMTKLKVLHPASPISVQADESLSNAIKIMQDHKFGCVLICEGKKIVGILSERDILYKVALKEKETCSQPVSSIMTKSPECLKAKDKIAHALNKMSVGGFRHIPILNRSVPVGVISIKDVLRYICNLTYK